MAKLKYQAENTKLYINGKGFKMENDVKEKLGGISKIAFVSLYKEFGEKYPYTYRELLAVGKVSDSEKTKPLSYMQIAILLIGHELDKLNLTWKDWDKYVSLIGEPVKYEYDPVSSVFGGQNFGWTKYKHNRNSGHTSRSKSDCSHTTKTAINSLHQTTWMM